MAEPLASKPPLALVCSATAVTAALPWMVTESQALISALA